MPVDFDAIQQQFPGVPNLRGLLEAEGFGMEAPRNGVNFDAIQNQFPGVPNIRAILEAEGFRPTMPEPEITTGMRLMDSVDRARTRSTTLGDVAVEVGKRLPFIGGFVAGGQHLRVADSANRISNNTATDEDYDRVADYLADQEAVQNRSFGERVLRNVGNVISYAPAFMIELLASKGIYTAGVRVAGVNIAAQIAKRVVENAAARGLVAVGINAALRGAVAAGTTGIGRTYASAAERSIPQLSVNDQGNVQAEDTGSWYTPSHLAAGFGDAAIEFGSEWSGGALPFLGRLAARRLPLDAVRQSVVGRLGASAWNASIGRLAERLGAGTVGARRLAGRVGFHGVAGEIFEERVGEVLKGLSRVSEDFGFIGDVLTGRLGEAGERLLTEAVSFGLIGGGTSLLGSRFRSLSPEQRLQVGQAIDEVYDAGGTREQAINALKDKLPPGLLREFGVEWAEKALPEQFGPRPTAEGTQMPGFMRQNWGVGGAEKQPMEQAAPVTPEVQTVALEQVQPPQAAPVQESPQPQPAPQAAPVVEPQPPVQTPEPPQEDVQSRLMAAASSLQGIEKEVFERRFYSQETLDSIAKSMGKSKEWIRQVEERALDRIAKSVGLSEAALSIEKGVLVQQRAGGRDALQEAAQEVEFNKGVEVQRRMSVQEKIEAELETAKPKRLKEMIGEIDKEIAAKEKIGDTDAVADLSVLAISVKRAQAEQAGTIKTFLNWLNEIEGPTENELKQYMRRLHSTVIFDPKFIALLTKYAAIKVAKAGLKFADFVTESVERYGEEVKPHLRAVYNDGVKMAVSWAPFVEQRTKDNQPIETPAPDTITGTHAAMDARREEIGAAPRVPTNPAGHRWSELHSAVAAMTPEQVNSLVAEIQAMPRNVTDAEHVVLVRKLNEIDNALTQTHARLEQAGKANDLVNEAVLDAEYSALMAQYESLADAIDKTGTQAGRSLNIRKLTVKRDFSLHRVLYMAKKAKKARLTEAEESELEALQKKLAEKEKQLEDLMNNENVKGIKNLRPRRTDGDPNALRDVDRTDPEAMYRLAKRIAMDIMARTGNSDTDFVTAGVHEALKTRFPDITIAETLYALGGNGIYRELSKEDLDVEFRRIKGESLQMSRLIQLSQGEFPGKVGLEGPEQGPEERRLRKEVEKGKRELENKLRAQGIKIEADEHRLKTALEVVKTRMRNQIDDMQNAIDAKRRIETPDRKPVELDAEGKAIEAKRDQLKEVYDSIFGPIEMTDEQRVQIAINAANRQTEMYEEQIKTQEFERKKRLTKETPELIAARARRDAARAEAKMLRDMLNPDAKFQRDDSRYYAYLMNQQARIAERLLNKDYAPQQAKAERELSPRTLAAMIERDNLRTQLKVKVDDLARQSEGKWGTAKRIAKETIHFATTFKLGWDILPFNRQGGFFVWNPWNLKKTFEITRKSLHALVDEKAEMQAWANIENNPLMLDGTFKKAGLKLPERHAAVDWEDERFVSRLAGGLPVLKQIERATRTFTALVRVAQAEVFINNMLASGGAATDAELQLIGNAANVTTGRGNFGEQERAVGLMGWALLSPRYVMSRFQMALLQPIWHKPNLEAGRARKAIAKEYAKTLVGVSFMLGLGYFGFSGDDDDKKGFFDYTSTDFLRPKAGNTRLDLLAGVQQPVVLMSRLITGESSNQHGDVRQIRATDRPLYREDAFGLGARFVRSRFAVAPAIGADLLAGQDVGYTLTRSQEYLWKTVLPLTPVEIVRAMQDLGVPRGMAAGIWATFGGGVQVQTPR